MCHTQNIKIKFPSTQIIKSLDSDRYCCTSFGHNIHGDIIECQECGLIALKNIPTPSELEQIYKQVIDPLYIQEKENRYLTFRKVIKDVQKYIACGKLLDIGCYCGYFLDIAAEAGFSVQGLELSKWASEQAIEHGHIVHTQPLSYLYLENYFDIITMWDVIEHFSDPRAELKEINRLLVMNGYLFLSTINVKSIIARLMRQQWPWYMDMHIYYFDPDTITMILEQEGFQVIEIKNYTHYISSEYLIKKMSYVSKSAELVFKSLQNLIGKFKIPFNLGDNMMVVAKKLKR